MGLRSDDSGNKRNGCHSHDWSVTRSSVVEIIIYVGQFFIFAIIQFERNGRCELIAKKIGSLLGVSLCYLLHISDKDVKLLDLMVIKLDHSGAYHDTRNSMASEL